MALASMTGFGRSELKLPDRLWAIELTAVNQKSLQVAVYGPEEWPLLESTLTAWIRPRVYRGKITVRLTSAEANARASSGWDETSLQASFAELKQLAGKLNIPFQPDARLLLELAESRRQNRVALHSWDDVLPHLQKSFTEALNRLVVMREQEGARLGKDLMMRVEQLEKLLEVMESSEKNAPERHRDLLLKRLKDLGLSVNLSDERVLKELTFYADRSDITEEIVRLRSHFSQFREELGGEKTGRKLDFLVQELLREVNTIGSKASEISTTKAVLEAKTEIERIREQVQNLE
jgi:uncharacterized protein (TIGR00255 family)